mmetsp:Transcript_74905/g.229201  ORF Transcript_74905/g.229201 Transcript_74905/m.229201 type:complete len:250 (-) Transcript_74905:719-1468(-)
MVLRKQRLGLRDAHRATIRLRLQRGKGKLGGWVERGQEEVLLRRGLGQVRPIRLRQRALQRRGGLVNKENCVVLPEQAEGLPHHQRGRFRLQRGLLELGGRLDPRKEDLLLRVHGQGLRAVRLQRRRPHVVGLQEEGLLLRQGAYRLPHHDGCALRLHSRSRHVEAWLERRQEGLLLPHGRRQVRSVRLQSGRVQRVERAEVRVVLPESRHAVHHDGRPCQVRLRGGQGHVGDRVEQGQKGLLLQGGRR